MQVYGYFCQPVELVRWATLDDFRRLQRPVGEDRREFRKGRLVVVRDAIGERLYHVGFLRGSSPSDVERALSRLR